MNTSKKEFIQQYPYLQENEVVSNAFDIAYNVHRKHIRMDWMMYITHPIASNEILRNEIFVDWIVDHTLQASSLLHDTLEDCDPSEVQTLRAQIKQSCGDRVLEIVDILTKNRPEHYMTPEQRNYASRLVNGTKIAFIESIKAWLRIMRDQDYFGNIYCDDDALLVKAAEWLHNMRTVDNLKPSKIEEMIHEKSVYLLPRLGTISPILEQLYLEEIEKMQERIGLVLS